MHYGIEKLVSLPKSALRTLYADLTLPFSWDTTRDELINNASNAMISNEEKKLIRHLN